jgi:hypothetical protein
MVISLAAYLCLSQTINLMLIIRLSLIMITKIATYSYFTTKYTITIKKVD